MKKILALLLAVTMMAGTMAACGGSGDTTTTPTPSTTEPSSPSTTEKTTDTTTPSTTETTETPATEPTTAGGQTVSVAMTSDPDTLDPGRADDEQKNAIVLEVQETLVRLINGKMEPAGAESWETSEDGLTWTFHLRDNKYSDGNPVKAQDYVNSARRIFDPEVNCHNAGIFYCIKGGQAFNEGTGAKEDVGVTAPDEKTVVFELVEPLPYFLQLINFANLSPVPEEKTQGEKNSSYGATAEEMTYSGPFMIESWTRGSNIVMKKNPNYWDAASVKLETINMVLAQDENTRQQMFDQGQLDILRNIRSEYADQLQSKIDAGEVTLMEGAQPRASYICFNNEDPDGIFSNEKIRKAFSIALDREAYAKSVLKKDQAAYGWIPYGLNCGDTIFRENNPEPMVDFVKEDPKALLEEGLKEIGKEGEQITVTFLQANSDNDTKVRAEYYQNQWQTKLGVIVNIDTASDNSSFNNQVSKGLYQVCQTGWGGDYNDPMTFMQCFVTGDGNNPAFFSDATYDELVNACKTEPDMAVREQKFAEAEKILTVDKCGIGPVTFTFSKNVANSKLKGYEINGAGGPAVEFKNAYIEE